MNANGDDDAGSGSGSAYVFSELPDGDEDEIPDEFDACSSYANAMPLRRTPTGET